MEFINETSSPSSLEDQNITNNTPLISSGILPGFNYYLVQPTANAISWISSTLRYYIYPTSYKTDSSPDKSSESYNNNNNVNLNVKDSLDPSINERPGKS